MKRDVSRGSVREATIRGSGRVVIVILGSQPSPRQGGVTMVVLSPSRLGSWSWVRVAMTLPLVGWRRPIRSLPLKPLSLTTGVFFAEKFQWPGGSLGGGWVVGAR